MFNNLIAESALGPKNRPSFIRIKTSDAPRRIDGFIWKSRSSPVCGPGHLATEEIANQFFNKYKDLFGMKNPNMELKSISITDERKDRPRVRYTQLHYGYRVIGAGIRVKFKNDSIIGVDSNYVPDIDINIKEKCTFNEAKKLALDNDSNNRGIKSELVEKVILDLENGFKAAWRVSVWGKTGEIKKKRRIIEMLRFRPRMSIAHGGPVAWDYFIDISSGEVIGRENRVRAQNPINVDGISYYDNIKYQLEGTLANGMYLLKDISQSPSSIFLETKVATSDDDEICSTSEDDDGHWDVLSQRIQVDCHYNTNFVYHYFKNRFDRNSYDNNFSPLIVLANYCPGSEEGNGAWCEYSSKNNRNYILIGGGDGIRFGPWCSLEMIAHEWTHALIDCEIHDNRRQIESSQGYRYKVPHKESNQWGSLQEALCDTFGAFMTKNWRIGGRLLISNNGRAVRDLKDPPQGRTPKKARSDIQAERYYENGIHPDHMDYYFDGKWDNYGEHLNATIIGKAANLMTEGGSHYEIDCGTGISWEVAEEIFYRVIVGYLLSSTGYEEFSTLFIKAADEILTEEITHNPGFQTSRGNDWKNYYLCVIQNSFAAIGIGNSCLLPQLPSGGPPKWSFLPTQPPN